MATLQLAAATPQVRPWPAGGTWNNITVSATKITQKSTTWGVTLKPGLTAAACAACNQWMNAPAGTADTMAHAAGLEVRDLSSLSIAQVAGGVTTNVVDREATLGPAQIVIVTTIGATPTCTYQLEGSLDGTNWNPLSSADSGTPTVFTTTTFVITTATTTTRIVSPTVAWRYIRLTLSAITNVTSTIDCVIGG